MNVRLTLPLLVPLIAAAIAMLAWRRVAVQRWIGAAGALGLLIAGIGLLVACSQRRHPGRHAARRLAGAVRHHPGGRPVQRDHGRVTGLMGVAVAVYSSPASTARERSATTRCSTSC
jgi:formate hydrogenlyase subunit 3/multisubunit Na+/H+ antiporter MnhD subunit